MQVIIENGDTKTTWGFTVLDNTNIILHSYVVQLKPKGKRKWQNPHIVWDRYMKRNSNIEEPTLPEYIKDQVVELYIEKIKVFNSFEYKR